MPRVLCPLPDQDFDLTEIAVPWRLMRDAGCEVIFTTEQGQTAATDPTLISGVIFGQLGALPEPIAYYREMQRDPAFLRPTPWADLDIEAFDGLWLAGGHAPGMRQVLGSALLQKQVAAFWSLARPVAAICHGVLVLARANDPSTGSSLLHARATTCLPKYMERIAYFLTAWKHGRRYRTYPEYVQDEVSRLGARVVRGPISLVAKGSRNDDKPAFIVEDGNYLSGRWPGDAYLLARRFVEQLRTYER